MSAASSKRSASASAWPFGRASGAEQERRVVGEAARRPVATMAAYVAVADLPGARAGGHAELGGRARRRADGVRRACAVQRRSGTAVSMASATRLADPGERQRAEVERRRRRAATRTTDSRGNALVR